VARRVSPTERLRAQIDELFGSDRELASILALILEEVARLSVRLMVQAAIETEVEAFLGRARCQRRDDHDRSGSRNGWQPPAAVKTTMGPVELQRPKLRGADQALCSRLFGAGVTRTNALEWLVISGWVRGLSDRDLEAALAEVLGPEAALSKAALSKAALSKSTVSRICQRIGVEFEAWRTRDLAGVRLDYLFLDFLDGSHFKLHPGAPAEPVLAAWGIDTDGNRRQAQLRGPGAGRIGVHPRVGRLPRRPQAPWPAGAAAGHQRRRPRPHRRLRPGLLQQPAPAVSVHRARTVIAKVSAHDQAEVKADFWASFDVGDAEPGDQAVAVANRQASELA